MLNLNSVHWHSSSVWMFMFGVGGSHGNYVNKLGYK